MVQLHRFLIQFGGERPAGVPQGNSVILLEHRRGQHRLDFPTERGIGVGLAAALDNLLQVIGIERPAKIVQLSAQTVRLLVNVRQLFAQIGVCQFLLGILDQRFAQLERELSRLLPGIVIGNGRFQVRQVGGKPNESLVQISLSSKEDFLVGENLIVLLGGSLQLLINHLDGDAAGRS